MEAQLDLQTELARRKSQYVRILDLLKEYGEATNLDFSKITFRYSARLHELRKDGYKIVAVYERPGVWRYMYLGHRDDK